MNLIESKTYINLAKSFAGESQAYVRYKFIEYGAREQGYKTLAEMIDTLAYNEFNHARMFYTFIQKATTETINNINISSGYPFKEKWDLVDNLRLAAEDELEEGSIVYPSFAETARKEGFVEIAKLYEDIIQVEHTHHKLLMDLHRQMKSKTLYKKKQEVKWKCADCGYEATGKTPWKICPLCLAKQGAVMINIEN